MSGWCTIESDPTVFTEMLKKFGTKGLGFQDVPSMDPEMLQMLPQPILGFVLLFKWTPAKVERNVIPDAEVYFAKQTVSDACATQAIVNILMNLTENTEGVDLGAELKQFREFTSALDPQMRGDMIGQSDVLRNAHNSFARPAVFSFEDKQPQQESDTYHFVGYTFRDGVVWELDGLQDGPIFIEPAEESTWLATAAEAISARMKETTDRGPQGPGISCNLMALTIDAVAYAKKQLAAAQAAGKSTDAEEARLQSALETERQGTYENSRRRHNYIPAFFALLRALKDKGELTAIIDANKESTLQMAARKRTRSEQ